MMKFTLYGEPTGVGKNHVQITRSGRRYPNALFEDWKEKCAWQIRSQCARRVCETGPMHLSVLYTPKDRRRRDATALLDGVFHVLEYTRLIKDDAQIKFILYCELPVDKSNPRMEILFTRADGTN